MEKWINVVETYPEPPEKEKDFWGWYINVHLPDCVATQEYQGARLYRAAAPEISNGRGKFLAIYFIETDDIDRTMQIRRNKRVEENQKGRGTDLVVNVWRDVLYKQIAVCTSKEQIKKKECWVNLIETNCDPTREDEYNDWYNNIHLPDTMETPGFIGARRYVQKEFRDGRGKYLSVYEIETDDISKTMEIRKARRLAEIDAGRGSDTWRSIWGNTLYRQIAECLP